MKKFLAAQGLTLMLVIVGLVTACYAASLFVSEGARSTVLWIAAGLSVVGALMATCILRQGRQNLAKANEAD